MAFQQSASCSKIIWAIRQIKVTLNCHLPIKFRKFIPLHRINYLKSKAVRLLMNWKGQQGYFEGGARTKLPAVGNASLPSLGKDLLHNVCETQMKLHLHLFMKRTLIIIKTGLAFSLYSTGQQTVEAPVWIRIVAQLHQLTCSTSVPQRIGTHSKHTHNASNTHQ